MVMVQHVRRRPAIRWHVGHAMRQMGDMMRRHVVVGVHVVGTGQRVWGTSRAVHVVRHDPRTQVRQRRSHVVAGRVAAGRAVQMRLAIGTESGGQQARRVRTGRRAGTGRDGAGARHVRRPG